MDDTHGAERLAAKHGDETADGLGATLAAAKVAGAAKVVGAAKAGAVANGVHTTGADCGKRKGEAVMVANGCCPGAAAATAANGDEAAGATGA